MDVAAKTRGRQLLGVYPMMKGTQGTPYYDDVVLQQREQELELKENVAYGPIQ